MLGQHATKNVKILNYACYDIGNITEYVYGYM